MHRRSAKVSLRSGSRPRIPVPALAISPPLSVGSLPKMTCHSFFPDIGICVFKASKNRVYLSPDQRAGRKMSLDRLREKSDGRLSRGSPGQSVPVTAHRGSCPLERGLDDTAMKRLEGHDSSSTGFQTAVLLTQKHVWTLLVCCLGPLPFLQGKERPEPSDQRARLLLRTESGSGCSPTGVGPDPQRQSIIFLLIRREFFYFLKKRV